MDDRRQQAQEWLVSEVASLGYTAPELMPHRLHQLFHAVCALCFAWGVRPPEMTSPGMLPGQTVEGEPERSEAPEAVDEEPHVDAETQTIAPASRGIATNVPLPIWDRHAWGYVSGECRWRCLKCDTENLHANKTDPCPIAVSGPPAREPMFLGNGEAIWSFTWPDGQHSSAPRYESPAKDKRHG